MAELWNFAAAIENAKRHITGADVRTLEACSRRLAQGGLEPAVDPGRIESLQQQANELIEGILGAEEIPVELRKFMFGHLEAVLRALREFRLRGPDALAEEFDLAFGSYRVQDMAQYRDQTEEARTWGNEQVRSWSARGALAATEAAGRAGVSMTDSAFGISG